MEQFSSEEMQPSNSLDFGRIVSKILKNWYWLLICMSLFLVTAYIYIRYTVPLYQVGAFLQIEAGTDAATMIGGSPFQQGGGKSREQYKDLNSELFKFKSAQLVGEVVDSLKLHIDLAMKGTVKNKPVFIENLPITITVKPAMRAKPVSYALRFYENSYTISLGERAHQLPYDSLVNVNGDSIYISRKNPSFKELLDLEYSLTIYSHEAATEKYMERMAAASVPKAGYGMLQIAVQDELVERGKRIIETVKYLYDYNNYEYRNRALQSEIEFLDQRVKAVEAELEQQEDYVKNFKAGNKITDVAASANQLLGNLAAIESKKSDNVYKDKLLNLVEADIINNSGKEERVNVTGIQDSELSAQVNKYNDLVSQKKNLLLQAAPKDLRLPPINNKLEDARGAVLGRISSLRTELAASNQFLQSQEKSTTGVFSTLPGKEKDYVQVNRFLNIKQALYVFLLQRKEDKSIELASSGMGESRTIDWKVSNVQEPKPIIIYLAAIVLGIILPAAAIATKMMFSEMIETSKDISSFTKLPVVGEIGFAGKASEEKVVLTDGTSHVAEHFRTLRTNLLFHCQRKGRNVILVTSGKSGEGKSFVSLNLGTSLALSNKKVVLVEFDLRDPGMLQDEDISRKPGIINFLTEETGLNGIINPVDGCPNLFFLSSGLPLSLNTGELLLDYKVKVLFEYLKLHYDYVIVDTPPVEAVSDALILSEFVDVSIFVVRHRYSTRSTLELINKLNQENKIPNPLLVVNSILPGGDFNHGYGYGYGVQNRYSRKKKTLRSKLKIA